MAAAAPPPAPGSSATPATDYPVIYDVEYPEHMSHWKPLVKWLLAIPQIIIVYLLGIVFQVLQLIAFFSVLFTKKWPRGLFDFALQIQRWTSNTFVYAFALLRDEYPPFSGEAGEYPLTLEVVYDENLSRWQIFVKWLLALPHYLVLAVLGIAASFAILIAFFAILFTGKYPRGLFDFVVGVIRYAVRVQAYAFWFMTDRYPPFSLK
jgi:Domain of unknown function (DUF4389)